jgi:hypothetical protein
LLEALVADGAHGDDGLHAADPGDRCGAGERLEAAGGVAEPGPVVADLAEQRREWPLPHAGFIGQRRAQLLLAEGLAVSLAQLGADAKADFNSPLAWSAAVLTSVANACAEMAAACTATRAGPARVNAWLAEVADATACTC